MKLAGIELRYLVDDLAGRTGGYYVSNIYGVSKESLLFKLHHPEKPDIMLMFSTFGLWTSSVRIEPIEQNRMLKRLRRDLLRLRLEGVEQLGTERIAYLRFRGFEKEFVLVGEFFGDGNIVLCNSEMKILALLHSLNVRHRELQVGLKYEPPPENNLDVFGITGGDLDENRIPDLSSDRWLGRTLGLPTRYVESIFHDAAVDSKVMCSGLTKNDMEKIADSVGTTIRRVTGGDHDPVIVSGGDRSEVYPINLTREGDEAEKIASFAEGLDKLFTKKILESGRDVQSEGTGKEILEAETKIAEQEKAIGTVRVKSEKISGLARGLLGLVTAGVSSFADPQIGGILRENDSDHITEKGIPLIRIQNEKIRIDPGASLHAIASSLFNEAKKQSGAIPEIERQMRKTQMQLDDLKNKSLKEKESVSFSEIRKKNWYERYRWFFTSDGNLAIGGRDASSNSSMIRKHLEKNDAVFHADIFGSPFFILKDGAGALPNSLNEVAHATVCFSRAWRESMYGLSAYWVGPEQVKRAAPSGQYLPKGSFTIDGQRNFVKISTLKLGVGLVRQDESYLLSCGPPETIRENSVCYAVIEPSGMEMTDVAKKIRAEFVRMSEGASADITIDDVVRVLPAGKCHIGETGRGGSP